MIAFLNQTLIWVQILAAGFLVLILSMNGACCLTSCCNMRAKKVRLQTSFQPTVVLWLTLAAQYQLLALASDVNEQSNVNNEPKDHKIPQNVALSSEDQRKIMMAIYAGIGSFQLIVGAIVVCILGMHGACCLCPKTEQQRLVELMKRNKVG